MDPRFLSARLASSLLRTTINLTGGGGTAAPGLIAQYIDSNSLKKLSEYVGDIIIVTGTNGKTTTSRIIGSVLEKSGLEYIHNREGSNLLRGIVGSLIKKTPLFPKSDKPIALLEVDEATLPLVISQTTPKIIIMNNLFRDQLDRYGEIEAVRKMWQKTIQNLDKNTTLILNSDDPSVAHLGSETKAKVVYFGVEDKKQSIRYLPHASDFTSCIVCGNELKYDEVYISHLGRYRCAHCGEKRPKPDVFAESIDLEDEEGFQAKIKTPKGNFTIKTPLPGLYNVYNSLSAISAAVVLGIPLNKIIQALKSFEAAFGRSERLEIEGKKLFIALAKNPTGFNELIRTIFAKTKKRYIFIAINDLIADGTDVSWLWDVDFELMKDKVQKVWLSGIRLEDINLRLKYAGIKSEKLNNSVGESLDTAYANLPKGETLFIFPTYTALLELKKYLSKKGYGKDFWDN